MRLLKILPSIFPREKYPAARLLHFGDTTYVYNEDRVTFAEDCFSSWIGGNTNQRIGRGCLQFLHFLWLP